jgi:hypothetical protein
LQPVTVLQEHQDGMATAGVAVDDDLLSRITLGPVLAYSRAFTSFAEAWGWQDHLETWTERSSTLASLLQRRL